MIHVTSRHASHHITSHTCHDSVIQLYIYHCSIKINELILKIRSIASK